MIRLKYHGLHVQLYSGLVKRTQRAEIQLGFHYRIDEPWLRLMMSLKKEVSFSPVAKEPKRYFAGIVIIWG